MEGSQIDVQSDLEKVQSRINVPVRKLPLPFVYVAAASVAVIFVVSYFLKNELYTTPTSKGSNIEIVDTQIETGSKKAVLTLEDGSNITLEKGRKFEKDNVNSNGEELTYDARRTNKKKIKHNYLTIPRGGQFAITLSDGTKVWLNSESQLKYPTSFVKGNDRVVELIYGEAYFDVTPSSNHQGVKFMVKNKGQEVEVLGTEFNIKAYKDEVNMYTTLVEGKVKVRSGSKKQELMPNEQSILNIDNGMLSVTTVDVYNEISWKEGIFSFENKTLDQIMVVLSRWYDMEVFYENYAVKEVEFNGSLGKDQSIVEILDIIKNFKIIHAYEIKNKTVILK